MGILGPVFIAVIIWLAARPVIIWRRKLTARKFWATQRDLASPKNAIHIVVLGDSISEGVGATHPQHSFIGQVTAYVAAQTSRPVVTKNYSIAGATSGDLIAQQLPQVDLNKADLILLEIGVNDGHKPRGTIAQYKKNLMHLVAYLPLEKTVISDMPFPKLRKGYQAVADEVLGSVVVARAFPSKVFVNFLPLLFATAGDFWHPNNRGHKMWFTAFKPGIDEVLTRYQLLKTKQK